MRIVLLVLKQISSVMFVLRVAKHGMVKKTDVRASPRSRRIVLTAVMLPASGPADHRTPLREKEESRSEVIQRNVEATHVRDAEIVLPTDPPPSKSQALSITKKIPSIIVPLVLMNRKSSPESDASIMTNVLRRCSHKRSPAPVLRIE